MKSTATVVSVVNLFGLAVIFGGFGSLLVMDLFANDATSTPFEPRSWLLLGFV